MGEPVGPGIQLGVGPGPPGVDHGRGVRRETCSLLEKMMGAEIRGNRALRPVEFEHLPPLGLGESVDLAEGGAGEQTLQNAGEPFQEALGLVALERCRIVDEVGAQRPAVVEKGEAEAETVEPQISIPDREPGGAGGRRQLARLPVVEAEGPARGAVLREQPLDRFGRVEVLAPGYFGEGGGEDPAQLFEGGIRGRARADREVTGERTGGALEFLEGPAVEQGSDDDFLLSRREMESRMPGGEEDREDRSPEPLGSRRERGSLDPVVHVLRTEGLPVGKTRLAQGRTHQSREVLSAPEGGPGLLDRSLLPVVEDLGEVGVLQGLALCAVAVVRRGDLRGQEVEGGTVGSERRLGQEQGVALAVQLDQLEAQQRPVREIKRGLPDVVPEPAESRFVLGRGAAGQALLLPVDVDGALDRLNRYAQAGQ
jgi:hypothetical protein